MSSAASRFRSNLFIVLVAIGAILLLGNVSLFQVGSLLNVLLRWWPLALITIGVLTLLRGKSTDFNRALFFTVIGIVLQIAMLGWLPSDLLQWWPFIAIVFGLWLLVVQPKNVMRLVTITTQSFHYRATLEGTKITVSNPAFLDGTLKSRFAMVEVDLASAHLAEAAPSLAVDIRAGTVTLTLPEAWRITTDVGLTLGTIRDQREVGNPPLLPETPQLLIRGSVTLGTLVIRDPGSRDLENPE